MVEKAVPTSTVAVAAPCSHDRERERCCSGGACARGDEGEVHPALDHHLLVAEEVQDRGGQRGAGGHQDQDGRDAASQQALHRHLYRPLPPPDEDLDEHMATSDYHRP